MINYISFVNVNFIYFRWTFSNRASDIYISYNTMNISLALFYQKSIHVKPETSFQLINYSIIESSKFDLNDRAMKTNIHGKTHTEHLSQ
jgi:hypothetical protein